MGVHDYVNLGQSTQQLIQMVHYCLLNQCNGLYLSHCQLESDHHRHMLSNYLGSWTVSSKHMLQYQRSKIFFKTVNQTSCNYKGFRGLMVLDHAAMRPDEDIGFGVPWRLQDIYTRWFHLINRNNHVQELYNAQNVHERSRYRSGYGRLATPEWL